MSSALKSGSLKLLEPSGPVLTCTGIDIQSGLKTERSGQHRGMDVEFLKDSVTSNLHRPFSFFILGSLLTLFGSPLKHSLVRFYSAYLHVAIWKAGMTSLFLGIEKNQISARFQLF